MFAKVGGGDDTGPCACEDAYASCCCCCSKGKPITPDDKIRTTENNAAIVAV